MKKTISILITAAMVITMAGCAFFTEPAQSNQATEPEIIEATQPKDTPSRIGTEGIMYASNIICTLEEAIERADLIVELTIIEWLDELEGEDFPMTYYMAKINRTFIGDEHDTIILRQRGNSQWTYDDYPLFKNGDRLFLFLGERSPDERMESNGIEYKCKYENSYQIVSSSQTTFLVWEHENQDYIVSRSNWNLAGEIASDNRVEVVDNVTKEAIVDEYLEYDPIFEEISFSLGRVFEYDGVVEMILEMSEEIELQ